ncbi:hypothetical protein BOTBODRAFT_28736 [Botryobasidium botryosum FD-172 SS1]|uniref:WW domain-containing protein n=1 Tax=Botryobasidium botryosum (strain FD-172 SS1) TaxID=930990 RepID=A0A067N3L3_BOTB1|nr:hypothetical protein BOTBODRAFT_28736 [Botryobasidium botryosum FD-172 SS1]
MDQPNHVVSTPSISSSPSGLTRLDIASAESVSASPDPAPQPAPILLPTTPPRHTRAVTSEGTLVGSPTRISPRQKGGIEQQIFFEEPEEGLGDEAGPPSINDGESPNERPQYASTPIELKPMEPDGNPRYEDIPEFEEEKIVVHPGYRPFMSKRDKNLPPGWEEYIHPEGKRYFVNESMRLSTHAIITGRPDTVAYLDQGYKQLHALCRMKNVKLPPDHELVIELPSDRKACHYYFVHHKEETVFWLHTVSPLRDFYNDIRSTVQSEYWLHREYWKHIEYFPMHNYRVLNSNPDVRVTDALRCGMVDHMTSTSSTFPLTATECATQIDALQSSKLASDPVSKGHRLWIIARIWWNIVHARIKNYHGHDSARVDRFQVVRRGPEENIFLRILQWFSLLVLFNAPNAHHRRLQQLYLERIVYREQWRKLVGHLIQEWTDTSLLATVLWTADMAFLAIEDINVPAQLGSLISTALALGSIITALLQIRQHRGRTDAASEDVADYLQRIEGRIFGLLPLAINYALPYALLIWSVAFFGLAVVFYAARFWYLETGKATILVMAIMVTTPVVWTTFFAWTSSFQGLIPQWQPVAYRLPRPERIRETLRKMSTFQVDTFGGFVRQRKKTSGVTVGSGAVSMEAMDVAGKEGEGKGKGAKASMRENPSRISQSSVASGSTSTTAH